MTARRLVDIGIFPSMKRANRRLNKLVKRRVIRMIGHAYLEGSWHCVYYAGQPFGRNVLQHNAEISLFKWALDCDEFERWDIDAGADGWLRIGELEWLYEHDRNTENDATVKARVAKLAETEYGVLWTAPTEARVRRLIKLTKPIANRCLYTTFDKAMDPHAEVWRYADGTLTSLPRCTDGALLGDRTPNASG